MAENLKPVVLGADGDRHVPVGTGDTIDAAYINKGSLISNETSNLLTTDADGNLLVSRNDIPTTAVNPGDLVSAQADNLSLHDALPIYVGPVEVPSASDFVSADADNNLQTGSDDKLFVPKPEATVASDLISAQTDNALELGADSKLFVDKPDIPEPADFISADSGNRVVLGTDNKLLVESQDLDPADLISTDINNSITRGSDSKLRVKVVSDDADNLITRGSDLGAKVKASDMISNGSTENLIIENATDHGLEVKKSDVESVVNEKLDDVTIVSADTGNIVRKGSDGGALITADDLPDQVSAGAGIIVNSGQVSVNVGKGLDVNSTTNRLFVDVDDLDIKEISLAASEKILALTSDQVLSSTLSFTYNSSTGYLNVLGVSGQLVDSVFIPGAEQALIGVEVVKDPVGYEAGTYFKYTFATAAGNVVSLVKVPEGSTTVGGDGINAVTADGVATVSARAGLGITVDSVGINVKPAAGKGVTVDTTGVGVKVKSSGGVTVDADGLAIDTTVVPTVEGLAELAQRVTDAESDIGALSDELAATSDNVTALSDRVDELDLNASTFTVSSTAVDPSALDNAAGALYPATNLLS